MKTVLAALAETVGNVVQVPAPGYKFIEYPRNDHALARGNFDALLGDIEEFITGHREHLSDGSERVLATVLFTNIVDSTRSAVEKGDQAWRTLLDTHDQLAFQLVEKHRGSSIKSRGDGILATFDGPGRAVRCALALRIQAEWIVSAIGSSHEEIESEAAMSVA